MNMKRFLKLPLYVAMGTVFAMGLNACSDDNNGGDGELSAQETALKNVVSEYLEKTVIPTYSTLADATIEMHEACMDMYEAGVGNVTTAQIQKAADAWFLARKYWELSEAWLYGAATDYYIDPHIDSWPLSKGDMEELLADPVRMGNMDVDGEYAGNYLGYGLLGFHAVEYMIFDSNNTGDTYKLHSTTYTTQELTYLAAVAGDLRNQCVRLEASWAGLDNVSSTKQQILADAELEPTYNYGDGMLNAGKGGSKWVNYLAVVQDMVSAGIQNIANEVGNIKIGNPTGMGDPDEMEYDPDYIESPYALNSIQDFTDNMISVQNAYQGFQADKAYNSGIVNIQPVNYSLSDYVKSLDPELDAQVRSNIEAAITAIQQMKEPFNQTAGSQAYAAINQAAVKACQDANDIFSEVLTLLSENH